jgi:hypothetical protein
MTRPLDIRSSVATVFANKKGLRYGTTVRLVNNRNFVVAAAANARPMNGSGA